MVERTADARIRTTEWEDIQYKHGNRVGQYRDREHEILAQKLVDRTKDALWATYDPTAERVTDKLERGGYEHPEHVASEAAARGSDSDGDDDDDEDDFLAQYRAQRRAKLEEQVARNAFGRLRRIAGATYVAEITEASRGGAWVVAVLVEDGDAVCDQLLASLDSVAAEHASVKFVHMVAIEAIPNFPKKQVPLTLLYRDGKVQDQVIREDWGKTLSKETVQRVLCRYGVLPRDEEPDEPDSVAKSKYIMRTQA